MVKILTRIDLQKVLVQLYVDRITRVCAKIGLLERVNKKLEAQISS